MARKTSTTSKKRGSKENKNTVPTNVKNAVKDNVTTLICKVTKIFRESDKCVTFGIDSMNFTPNEKIGHAWLNAVYFEDEEITEGGYYVFDGYFTSREYNGKWSNQFVVTGVEVIE